MPSSQTSYTVPTYYTMWVERIYEFRDIHYRGKRFLLIKKKEDCTKKKKINVQWRIFTGIKLSDLYDSPFNAPPASNNLLRGKCFTSVYACSMSRTYLPAHEIPQISQHFLFFFLSSFLQKPGRHESCCKNILNKSLSEWKKLELLRVLVLPMYIQHT